MIEPLPPHLRRGYLHMVTKGGISPLHDIKKGVWRVPIRIVNDEFKVWVGTNYFRIFSKQTLPDAIKSRLAIVQAQGCRLRSCGGLDFETTTENANPWGANPLYGLIYLSEDIDGMEDTGWRVNEEYYTVVLPHEDMVSLRGEMKSNDTRRKSKGKG